MSESRLGPPARSSLSDVESAIERAWAGHRAGRPDQPEGDVARAVLEDPSRHGWPLVDAALARLVCASCGAVLGSGPRGCGPCDLADGFRFAAREPDRDGVPGGNEHAIRVSSAVLRSPLRYPAWAVRTNEAFLPLFVAGQMPTRREQETILAAVRRGWMPPEAGDATTFAELAERARRMAGSPTGRD